MAYNKKWSTDETCQLINALKMHPALWNSRHVDSRNKNKKLKSLKTLAAMFDVSIVEIERKLRNINSQYYRERRYYLKYKKFGVAHEFNATWFGYKLLSFMHDDSPERQLNEIPVKIEFNDTDDYDPTANLFNNNSSTTNDIHEQITESASNLPDTEKRKTKKLKSDRVDKELFSMLKTTIAKQCQPNEMPKNDEYRIFGEFVATKVRNLRTHYAQCTVQHIINNILYDADMGKYDSPDDDHHKHHQSNINGNIGVGEDIHQPTSTSTLNKTSIVGKIFDGNASKRTPAPDVINEESCESIICEPNCDVIGVAVENQSHDTSVQ